MNAGVEALKKQGPMPKSPVKALFTSRSSAGSWQIRGEQVAAMRSNWQAINKPTDAELAACDVLCVVKKPNYDLVEKARKLGKPVVYDIVDCWAQPEDNTKYTDLAGARELFKGFFDAIKADAYVFATETMRKDLGSLVDCGVTIYHHVYPALGVNPLRDKVATLGYEGLPAYLAAWQQVIDKLCAERGLRFVVNPQDYTDIDVMIAARGGVYATYMTQRYKSNVKTVNAYGSGTPALVHVDEMSAHDTDEGDILFFRDADSLARQLDRLCADYALRQSIHTNFLKAAEKYAVQNIANQFEMLFMDVVNRKKNGVRYESAA